MREMETILDGIRGRRALVIGDVMLDCYVWGNVRRISPEAPVPVVEIARDSYTAGGAANVAVNMRALGAEVEVCGWIGEDEPGRRLIGILDENGVVFRRELFLSKAPTICKTRIIAQHQQLCRLDREAAPDIYAFDAGRCMEPLLAEIPGCDVVVLADYAKGFLNSKLVGMVCGAARAAGKIVALDPKPEHRLAYEDLDLMTPNRKESLQLAGIEIGKHDAFPAGDVCAAIWRKFKPRHLVVTMGEEGMLLSERGKVFKHIPTVARAVFDVSGAGDTVIATLSLALATGAGLEAAAHLANAAAGVVVGKVGTATASPAEILAHHERP